ncbi:ArpU family phage transcriptional regulator [Streptococcus rupicaprae]|uniref:ArpU family phage transcriptional regulator n=1 Tax=Streptococcus rupicaprae TaxID=759619 RepID=A0ABV2FJD6_9STRE
MAFFPEIDIEKTKANAERKLREHRRWRAVASEVGDQKVTATYSFEPRQPHGQPNRPVERLAINRADAISELDAIEFAIGHLFEPSHRRILFDKYIMTYPKSNRQIANELGYEKTQYHDILNAALLAFAELYRDSSLVVEKSEN